MEKKNKKKKKLYQKPEINEVSLTSKEPLGAAVVAAAAAVIVATPVATS